MSKSIRVAELQPELQKFAALMKALIKVPKSELDELVSKEKIERSKRPRAFRLRSK
jgi:hypothetical protein